MAIADVAEYAHLSDADLEALGSELEAIRRDIEDSLGENDRAYIQRAIAFQRCLEVAARQATPYRTADLGRGDIDVSPAVRTRGNGHIAGGHRCPPAIRNRVEEPYRRDNAGVTPAIWAVSH